MKRIFDFALASFALFISLPLWLVIIYVIYIDSGRPFFFSSLRVGKEGKFFKSMQFRSMAYSSEAQGEFLQAREDDARITKWGKFMRNTALDELPQLLNIVKGDMSFVGPRPLVLKEKEVKSGRDEEVFNIPGFKDRCVVRPGLTGVAQIFAPRDILREDKFKYDIWYVKNRSFLLDIYLIIISLVITFRHAWERREYRFRSISGSILEGM